MPDHDDRYAGDADRARSEACEAREPSSPPCSMHEVDPAYWGFPAVAASRPADASERARDGCRPATES